MVFRQYSSIVWLPVVTIHVALFQNLLSLSGRYKVQIFDKNVNDYVPTIQGLGMHVEIKDPDTKVVVSRVSERKAYWFVCCVITMHNI